VTTIHLGRRLPGASSNLPGRPDPDTGPGHHRLRADARARPYSVLLPVGFAVPLPLPERGALLPHRFTLTSSLAGGAVSFCGTVPEVRPRLRAVSPPDVIRHRMSMEPGLSSQGYLSHCPKRRPAD